MQAFFIIEVNMFQYLKSLIVAPTALEIATRELAQAKVSALQEQTMREYSFAQAKSHQAMVEFHQARIERLNAYINNQTSQSKISEVFPPIDMDGINGIS